MYIEIIEILRNGKVRFKTKHGTAVGQWMEKEKPQLKRYFVEIDVEEQLKYEDFEIAGDAMFQIKAMQDGVKLSGFLEEYDEDGYIGFRIDESFIGIDVQPYEKFNDMVGEYVSISVEKINVYDEKIM